MLKHWSYVYLALTHRYIKLLIHKSVGLHYSLSVCSCPRCQYLFGVIVISPEHPSVRPCMRASSICPGFPTIIWKSNGLLPLYGSQIALQMGHSSDVGTSNMSDDETMEWLKRQQMEVEERWARPVQMELNSLFKSIGPQCILNSFWSYFHKWHPIKGMQGWGMVCFGELEFWSMLYAMNLGISFIWSHCYIFDDDILFPKWNFYMAPSSRAYLADPCGTNVP